MTHGYSDGPQLKALITSVVRQSRPHEPSGFVHMADLESWRALGQTPIFEPPFLAYESNPRGGLRGAKGMAVIGDRLCLANASAIRIYDFDWRLVRTLSHPSCASIHDILARDGSLWIASSRNDLVVQMDLDGRIRGYFNYQDYPHLIEELNLDEKDLLRIDPDTIYSGRIDFRDPRTHRLERANAAHVNSMCFLPDGSLIVSLGRLTPWNMSLLFRAKGWLNRMGVYRWIVAGSQAVAKVLRRPTPNNSNLPFTLARSRSALVRVYPDGRCAVPLVLYGTTVPNHSLRNFSDGRLYYLDTNAGDLLELSGDATTIRRRIPVAKDFLRGMELLPNGHALVGSQFTLYEVDLEAGRVLRSLPLAGDPRISIFDIRVVPDRVAPLPPCFS